MNKFLRHLSIFILSWIILIFGIEYYLENFSSTFKIKYDYIKNERQEIEVLALGSSHIQNGINPKFITKYKMVNLAFGGQTIILDQKILAKFIDSLPSLKYVILELGYQSLEKRNKSDYHRNSLYLRFYKINNFGRNINLKDYSIFLSKPKLYLNYFNPFSEKLNINKFGYKTTLSLGADRFRRLNYDKELINSDVNNIFIKRHKYEDLEAFTHNTEVFEKMLVLCKKRNVIPIVIIPPVYYSYYRQMIDAKKLRRDSFIDELKNRYINMIVFDYEQDKRFIITDYKNEDHLNPSGGEKFSKILNDTLFNSISNAQVSENFFN